MSDTIHLAKAAFSSSAFSCFLYVSADALLDIGHELQSMSWDGMTPTNIIGWSLAKLGGIAIMVKAFYSKSSPTPTIVTTTL